MCLGSAWVVIAYYESGKFPLWLNFANFRYFCWWGNFVTLIFNIDENCHWIVKIKCAKNYLGGLINENLSQLNFLVSQYVSLSLIWSYTAQTYTIAIWSWAYSHWVLISLVSRSWAAVVAYGMYSIYDCIVQWMNNAMLNPFTCCVSPVSSHVGCKEVGYSFLSQWAKHVELAPKWC